MSLDVATFQFTAKPDGPSTAPETRESAAAVASPAGPGTVACPQCGNLESWGRSSWCPECGFYPRLGTSVGRTDETTPAADQSTAPRSPREVWQQMPGWGKVLCLGIVAIFVESLFVSAATKDDWMIRKIWGLLQFATGFGVFAMFHVLATLKASMVNNRIGIMDAIAHPLEVWRPTIDQLPHSARRIWLATWGLTAAACAMVIVGGIHYSALVDDWGFKKRVDSALTSHVRGTVAAKAARSGSAAGDPKAMTQEQTEDHTTLAAESTQVGNDVQRLALDCVVVGYNVNPRDGALLNLKLASLVDGELQYVGTVSKGIQEDVGKELAQRLGELKRRVPVAKCPGSAIWVKPVVTCKATFESWSDERLMIDPEFQEVMAEIDYIE